MGDKRKSDSETRADTICTMLDNYYRHTDKVEAAARLLGTRLIRLGTEEDNEQLGMLLLWHVREHDRSKLQGIEWPDIHQVEDKEALIRAIDHHQRSNHHHPEFWPKGMEGMPPYRNQTQATPHQGGQYCKKSYAGGDNNIERTQARRRTPAPPGACMRASIYNVFWVSLYF